jgi:site-specific DNA recombinase
VGTAIYCRISSDPEEREAGVTRQEADCRELVARHGLTPDVSVYVDNDVSASQPMEARPEFMRMLSDAVEGKVSTIVAWRDDRLWRNPDHQRAVFSLAVDLGITKVVTTEGTYDPAAIGDRLISGVKALFAEYEAASTKLRVNRALQDRADKGLPHGGVRPFGYARDRMTVVEDEAALVSEAVDRVLEGESLAVICRDWTERGVDTVNGGRWRPRTLRGILTNPRYVGQRVHRGEVVAEAAWPAIVDEVRWKRLQRLFASRTRGRNADRHLLSGMLQCSRCDDLLASGVGKQRQRVYRTHRQGNPETSCGEHVSVLAEPAERLMRDAVIERLSHGLAPASIERDDERNAELLDELDQVKAQLDELNAMWLSGEVTRQERATMREGLVKRQEALEASLTRAACPTLPDDVPSGREALETAWEASDVRWKRQVIQALVPRVTVDPAPTERECVWCGTDISDRSKATKYCSHRCVNAAYEDRKRNGADADQDPYQGLDQRLHPQWVV